MPSLMLLKRVPYDLILVVGIKHWQCYLDHRYVPNTDISYQRIARDPYQ